MSKFRFDGEDPITIFNCFIRFVTEGEPFEMTEGQVFIALPHLISCFCLKQYSAI